MAATVALLMGSHLCCMPPHEPRLRLTIEQARRRTVLRFADAVLLKPEGDSSEHAGLKFAPIFVQELVEGEADVSPFGAWVEDGAGRLHVDPSEPTVYAARSYALINGTRYPQWAYLWFPGAGVGTGAGAGAAPDSSRPPTWGLLRITTGSEGFPAIWEAYASGMAAGLIFVSHRVEESARDQFGPGLAGRFAVEQPGGESGIAIVARVLDDGPQPMGPMVYLDGHGQVTTITCRCMPAQVNAIERADYYALRATDGLTILDVLPTAQTMFLPVPPVALPKEIDTLADPEFLGTVLRLGDGF